MDPPTTSKTIATSSSESSQTGHGDQELSDSSQVQRSSGEDSKAISGDSTRHDHLARDLTATPGNTDVKIPNPGKRKGKLDAGENRLVPHSFCHACRTGRQRCVRCPACSSPFCERCLDVRHGESFHEVCKPEIEWLCPRCRRGCGRGCDTICCTCSCCRNRPKNVRALTPIESKQFMNKARIAGWNLHDYQIHVQTKESKVEIAKRKLCFGWAAKLAAKANDDTFMHSNVIDKGTDYLQTKHESPVEKERPPLHQSEESSRDEEMDVPRDLHNVKENNAQRDRDIDTRYEALRNSLIPYRHMGPNTQLMAFWLNKEKDLTGNKMSITLTKDEMRLTNNIEKRSHAGAIQDGFNPAKLKSLPREEQESTKEKLEVYLGRELAEYVGRRNKTGGREENENTRISRIYQEVDQQRTTDYLTAKANIDLYIERMKEAVEMACTEID